MRHARARRAANVARATPQQLLCCKSCERSNTTLVLQKPLRSCLSYIIVPGMAIHVNSRRA